MPYDPGIISAICGAAGGLAAVLVDFYLKREDRARASRDELRQERDLEVRRRRDAEERVANLIDERDSAENGSRLARQAAERAVIRMQEVSRKCSEYELELEGLRTDYRQRGLMIETLRAELARALEGK